MRIKHEAVDNTRLTLCGRLTAIIATLMKNHSQKEIAKVAGVSAATISRIYNGRWSVISFDLLLTVADNFNLDYTVEIIRRKGVTTVRVLGIDSPSRAGRKVVSKSHLFTGRAVIRN